jgi:hypothetical protein
MLKLTKNPPLSPVKWRSKRLSTALSTGTPDFEVSGGKEREREEKDERKNLLKRATPTSMLERDQRLSEEFIVRPTKRHECNRRHRSPYISLCLPSCCQIICPNFFILLFSLVLVYRSCYCPLVEGAEGALALPQCTLGIFFVLINALRALTPSPPHSYGNRKINCNCAMTQGSNKMCVVTL